MKINVISTDNQFNITGLSNNIRVVSTSITDNSNYYNNLQMTFSGTFVPSQQAVYISTIYNYFLKTYNLELMGPISCYSGSITFVSGVDQSNPSVVAAITNGTTSNGDQILPGFPLISFSLGTYQQKLLKDSPTSSQTVSCEDFFFNGSIKCLIKKFKSSSSISIVGLVVGLVVGIAVLVLITVGIILLYRRLTKRKLIFILKHLTILKFKQKKI